MKPPASAATKRPKPVTSQRARPGPPSPRLEVSSAGTGAAPPLPATGRLAAPLPGGELRPPLRRVLGACWREAEARPREGGDCEPAGTSGPADGLGTRAGLEERAVRLVRGTAASGNAFRSTARSACPVTHTDVWSLAAEYA